MKKTRILPLIILAAALGCSHKLAPLPTGAINSVDAQINADLQASQAGLKQYEADSCDPAPVNPCTPTHTPTATEKVVVNNLINAYNAAFPIYQSWHLQLAIDPTTPEPQQLATLIGAVAGDLTQIETFIQGVK